MREHSSRPASGPASLDGFPPELEPLLRAAILVAGDAVSPAAIERVRVAPWSSDTTAGQLYDALLDATRAALEAAATRLGRPRDGDVVDLVERRKRGGK